MKSAPIHTSLDALWDAAESARLQRMSESSALINERDDTVAELRRQVSDLQHEVERWKAEARSGRAYRP